MDLKEQKRNFVRGAILFDLATMDGERVFTLSAARKHTEEELYCILDYLTMSDKVDILNNKKNTISLNNIFKAIDEKAPPENEKEETAAAFERFKMMAKEMGLFDD